MYVVINNRLPALSKVINKYKSIHREKKERGHAREHLAC